MQMCPNQPGFPLLWKPPPVELKVYEELSRKLPVALLGEGGDPGAKVHNYPQGPSEQTGV